MSSDICSACNTSIYETFGAGEESEPEVDARTAALWGLLPGGGHYKVGQAGLGLADLRFGHFDAGSGAQYFRRLVCALQFIQHILRNFIAFPCSSSLSTCAQHIIIFFAGQ